MQNLLDTLKEVLSQDENLVIDGKLNKALVEDLALKLDASLLRLLLQNESINNHFFTDVDGTLVFDKVKFQQFINNKSFLPDSYTSYKNKIGLTTNGQFLSEGKEVVLSWPYKDCVLEGGQTEEDQRRKEIFWNEILAPDEIDRLLEPKVLTDFKHYDSEGEHELTEIADTDNFIIKGNNLLALHSLKKRFAGQVKLIYIDPPYNTGNDSFGYNDRFIHSTWLTFIKNRLEIAITLLSDDGSIWINMDDNEAHYLKILGDEIFGRENYVTTLTWEKKVSPSNDATWFSSDHDYILIYAKQKANWILNRLPMNPKQKGYYKNPDNDPRGDWNSATYTCNKSKEERPNLYYPIKNPTTGELIYPSETAVWAYSEKKHQEHLKKNLLYWGKDGRANKPRLKKFISQAGNVVPRTVWHYKDVGHTQEAKKEIIALAENEIFATPKPERLLQRIIQIATNPGDIVLDFFAGSGTTAAVAHKMRRLYITVEQMDYVNIITTGRLKKVIGRKVKPSGKMLEETDYDKGGISKSVGWQGGGSFVYCELMTWNELFVQEIQTAKDNATLLSVWDEMQKDGFLSYKIQPKSINPEAKVFQELSFEEQQRFLIEVLDKNMLYVNYSDMDDEDYAVSDEDKRLTDQFYKLGK